MFGNLFGLVKSSFALPPPIQWNGDEKPVFFIRCEPWVVEGELGESGKFFTQVDLPEVFEIVNQASAVTFAVQRCPGKFKGEGEGVAVRANEGVGKLAVIAFSTLLTEGWLDELELIDAVGAEVPTVSECAFTDLAGGGVDEIEESRC